MQGKVPTITWPHPAVHYTTLQGAVCFGADVCSASAHAARSNHGGHALGACGTLGRAAEEPAISSPALIKNACQPVYCY